LLPFYEQLYSTESTSQRRRAVLVFPLVHRPMLRWEITNERDWLLHWFSACARINSKSSKWQLSQDSIVRQFRHTYIKPRPDMQLVLRKPILTTRQQLVDGNLLPVWASCIVWATSCSKLNMFNIAQLVARCDFLLLKQATCCVDKLLILSRHATCCRQLPATSRRQLCMSGRGLSLSLLTFSLTAL